MAQRCYMGDWRMAEELDSDQCAEVPCEGENSVSAIDHSDRLPDGLAGHMLTRDFHGAARP
jgi:hypothetical protein